MSLNSRRMKPSATRNAAIQPRIKEGVPGILEQLITRPNMGYEGLKRAIIASPMYLGIGIGMVGKTHRTVMFQTTASRGKRQTGAHVAEA